MGVAHLSRLRLAAEARVFDRNEADSERCFVASFRRSRT
jgi:hypothetical protein